MSVDYSKEPLAAWNIISGPKMLELTGGGQGRRGWMSTCASVTTFDAPQHNVGETLDYCKAKSVNK
jgi:hypothetical protein